MNSIFAPYQSFQKLLTTYNVPLKIGTLNPAKKRYFKRGYSICGNWRATALQVVHLWSRPSTPMDQIITRADYSYKGAPPRTRYPRMQQSCTQGFRVYLLTSPLRNTHVCETVRGRLRACASSLRICTPPFVWCPKNYNNYQQCANALPHDQSRLIHIHRFDRKKVQF